MGCALARPGEYDWIVHAAFLSNYFVREWWQYVLLWVIVRCRWLEWEWRRWRGGDRRRCREWWWAVWLRRRRRGCRLRSHATTLHASGRQLIRQHGGRPARRRRKTAEFRRQVCCARRWFLDRIAVLRIQEQSVVTWSVSLSVCHDHEPCKSRWTDSDAIWVVHSSGPKEPCIRRGSSDSPCEGAIWREKGATLCKVWGLSAVSCAKMTEPIKISFRLWPWWAQGRVY